MAVADFLESRVADEQYGDKPVKIKNWSFVHSDAGVIKKFFFQNKNPKYQPIYQSTI